MVGEARRSGFIETVWGRRRNLRDLPSDKRRRDTAERLALNSPIHSSAADLVKVAMLRVEQAIADQRLRSWMLQVRTSSSSSRCSPVRRPP
jgi:DNA polymerase-1